MFRVGPDRPGRGERPEVLLLRRSPGRILPGPVAVRLGLARARTSASRSARCASCARRPDSGRTDIEAFYDLDLVNQFHEPSIRRGRDGGRFRRPAYGPESSRCCRTSTTTPAGWRSTMPTREVIWPGYRTAIERIRDDLSDQRARLLVRADARGRPATAVMPRMRHRASLVDSGSRRPTVRRHRRAT